MLKKLTMTAIAATMVAGLAIGPGVGSAVAAPWGWHDHYRHRHQVCRIVWRHHHRVEICHWLR
ncbi:MAG TPA: hypothetical protein VL418_03390 [Devosiaceae bacterium]|nr:hypothetical protein [Devosiaceae bacterium]